ncbi:hypothetical protein KKE47_00960 [Patescibacteria group bacterium]|nr:hypothetical protein [Patescibacteria group bacterium]MCG2701728.1 hypothetical protein [Candidatus Parcubacteria bacterium]MBU4264633.1 hypothetical protein [Patescibacteria group bacterium]MBU4390588.1 hypothetical protein [Patescibacteria group bacterium]MBU4431348.1 hypothetical protein [Patescibacteria group bacterium]
MKLKQTINLINKSKINFYFLVVDNFLDIDLPFLKNFHLIYAYTPQKPPKSQFFCLQQNDIKLKQKNSGKLLANPKVINYIKQTSFQNNSQPAIIPFKPSGKISHICQENNWLQISNSSTLNRLFENKFKFIKICQNNKITTIPSYIDKFNSNNFKKYQFLFKNKNLVIQKSFGWAGKGTFTGNQFKKIKNKITSQSIVKFSPKLSGYTLLNNCCIFHSRLIQSPPALQFTGIPPFTKNPLTTVGRQWPCLTSTKVKNQVKAITLQFSQILLKYNYQGFFGLDFFVNQKQKVFLLECNARLTASFAFYTQIELKNNILPLFILHLAEFCQIPLKVNIKKMQSRFSSAKITGSEITYKDQSGNTKRKINAFTKFSQSINPPIIKIHEK